MQPALKPIALAACACITVLALDVLTKWVVVRTVGPSVDRRDWWLVKDWIGLTYSQNTGIAFGLFQGSPSSVLTVAAIAAMLVLGLFVWMHRADPWLVLAGSVIAGGAGGNMLDRIRFGHVRDFVAIGPWPPFNFSDSAITLGALTAAFCLLRSNANQAPNRTVDEGRPAGMDTRK